jgi:hypothetical protein
MEEEEQQEKERQDENKCFYLTRLPSGKTT